jgi:hypothetical protein
MVFQKFWYCVRLELKWEQREAQYARFFREALKTLFPDRFNPYPPILPKTDFLFVIITENHIKHFRPVAEELMRKKHSFSIIYTNATLFQKYGSEWPDASFLLQSWAGQQQHFRAVLFQTMLLLTNAFASSHKKAVIIRFAKPVYLIYRTMLRLLPGIADKVVLFKAEACEANAVLLACRQKNIPSFAIQHGLIGDTDQVSHLMVDTYLVWAEFFKKRLQNWQAGCQVKITGNAAYDLVFRDAQRTSKQDLPALPLHILVLPNSGVSHTPLSQVHGLLDAAVTFARKTPAARVTVKPHPADFQDNIAKYLQPYLEHYSNIQLLDRYAPIPLEQAHMIAINNSGAGMEACIWQKPLLVFASTWEEIHVKQYVEFGVAEFADTPNVFNEKVLKIKAYYADYQDKCRAFIQNQLAYHGHAAEKIVEALTC